MKLYKDSGTNPFASCLPILLQMPIFLALFRLIDQAAKNPQDPKGFMTEELNEQFGNAVFLGREDLRHLPVHRPAGNVRVLALRPGRRDDGDHVPHPAPADEQEHAGRRADRSVRPAAEAAALRAARGVRRRWHRVPDRRALLLDHLEPVDDGPAVLRDPQQPGARARRPSRPSRTATRRRRAQGPARWPATTVVDRWPSRGQAAPPSRASSRRSRPAPSARSRRPASSRSRGGPAGHAPAPGSPPRTPDASPTIPTDPPAQEQTDRAPRTDERPEHDARTTPPSST